MVADECSADYDRKWTRLLKDNLLTYFHSKRLRHGTNEFKNWSEHSKRQLVRNIDKLQNGNTLCRFVAVMRKDEYEGHYKTGERPRKIPLDSMYGLCFRISLGFAAEIVERSGGIQDSQINFILESGHRNYGDAKRIFEQIKKGVPELADVLGTCESGDKKEFPGLQGADAVSYAGYQQEKMGDDSGLMDFAPEWNLDDARTIVKARSPVMRCYARPDIMEELRTNLVVLEETRRKFGQRKRAAMKLRTFEGKDEQDLEQQLWEWRSANPGVVVKHTHPIEGLPLELQERKPGSKIEPKNLVSMRVDYED